LPLSFSLLEFFSSFLAHFLIYGKKVLLCSSCPSVCLLVCPSVTSRFRRRNFFLPVCPSVTSRFRRRENVLSVTHCSEYRVIFFSFVIAKPSSFQVEYGKNEPTFILSLLLLLLCLITIQPLYVPLFQCTGPFFLGFLNILTLSRFFLIIQLTSSPKSYPSRLILILLIASFNAFIKNQNLSVFNKFLECMHLLHS
jgi:hypothetical protein